MSAAFALGMKAAVHRMMQEAQPALETAKAAMSEAEELGFLHVLHYAAIMKGWALTELGRADEGLALTREHVRRCPPAGRSISSRSTWRHSRTRA